MVPHSILVPTDGSGPAKAAEAFAADVARMMGDAEIEVVHVIPMSCVGLDQDVTTANIVKIREVNYLSCTQEEHKDAGAIVKAAAERVKALTGAGVKVTPKVIEAPSPAGAIIDEAHFAGTCSLIVMGNRGRGGFSSLALGSVSTQVLHGAHCPVVVVKAGD
jgi:nucleotide-binding universal stress UspA family protein